MLKCSADQTRSVLMKSYWPRNSTLFRPLICRSKLPSPVSTCHLSGFSHFLTFPAFPLFQFSPPSLTTISLRKYHTWNNTVYNIQRYSLSYPSSSLFGERKGCLRDRDFHTSFIAGLISSFLIELCRGLLPHLPSWLETPFAWKANSSL